MAQSNAGGHRFDPAGSGNILFIVEIDHEIFSMVILFLVQDRQLSVSGERGLNLSRKMCG